MARSDYAYDVDGLVLPVLLGGHPALDFCNTRAGWGEPDPKEYLSSGRHLATWAREAGLVADAGGPADLERALALREALYDVLTGGEEGWPAVAREAEAAAGLLRLVPGPAGAAWRLDAAAAGSALPALAVARAAADLLVSPDAARVRRCPGHGCGWLFLDRRGRRRWCTMATCGNRAKARRHHAARRGASQGARPPRSTG